MSTSGTKLTIAILATLVALMSTTRADARGCKTELVFQGYEHFALDGACLSLDKGRATTLKISNLGSSGCDGYSIALDDLTGPPDPGVEIDLAPVDIMQVGTTFTGLVRGDVNGLPADSVLLSLHAVADANGVSFTPDFSGVGSQSHRVEILSGPNVVASVPMQTGTSVRVMRTAATIMTLPADFWVFRCDLQGGDIIKMCFDTDGKERIPFEIISTGIVHEGDGLRVVAENRTEIPQSFSSVELMAGGIPEFTVISEDVSGTSADPCQEAESAAADVLYVNGKQGGDFGPYDVHVGVGDLIWTTMLLPSSGGNGKYLVHANLGTPTPVTKTALPAQLGTFCFPLFLAGGATPAAIWNNIGKESQVGAGMYFDGSPIADPANAPAVFLLLHDGDATWLPVGTEVTFQGIIVDPSSPSPKSASTTNAVMLSVL